MTFRTNPDACRILKSTWTVTAKDIIRKVDAVADDRS